MSTAILRVRSPIHVGGVDGLVTIEDFVHVGDRLHRISALALEAWLRENNLVSAYLAANESSSGVPFSLADFLCGAGVDVAGVLPLVTAYEVSARAGAPMGEVRPFLRDPSGLPYLPGSTIKGALRTGMLAEELRSNGALRRVLAHAAGQSRSSSRNAAREVERGAFARARYSRHAGTTQQLDLWRFVLVGDSPPIRAQDVAVLAVQVWNLRRDGSPYIKLSVYAECLLPGVEVRFPLRLDEPGLRAANLQGAKLAPEGIVGSAARWARSVWEDEAATLEGLGLTTRLAPFYGETPAGIRLGWGCGWHSLGVGRLVPDDLQRRLASRSAEGLPFPKTRKIAMVAPIGSMPLGWADLALT